MWCKSQDNLVRKWIWYMQLSKAPTVSFIFFIRDALIYFEMCKQWKHSPAVSWSRIPTPKKHDSARPPPLRLCAAVITQESLCLASCLYLSAALAKACDTFPWWPLGACYCYRPFGVRLEDNLWSALWLWKRAPADAHSHKEPMCTHCRHLKAAFTVWKCVHHWAWNENRLRMEFEPWYFVRDGKNSNKSWYSIGQKPGIKFPKRDMATKKFSKSTSI